MPKYAPAVPTAIRNVRFSGDEWAHVQQLIDVTGLNYSALVRRGLAMVADEEGIERSPKWSTK